MKNDSPKVLNVLERMGMVRKSDEKDETEQPEVFEEPAYKTENEPAYVPEPIPEPESEPEPVYTPAYVPPVYVSEPTEQRWEESENKSEVGEKMNESSFWDDSPAFSTDPDKFMEVEEIYQALNLKTGGTDTIYLVEEYMKTLPDSLPAESRRAIIMKIVGASGFDFDKLLNDGIERVTKLNEYAASFAQQTDKIVARHNSELDALEKQIQRVRELIGDRKNLHKRQFLSIENEAQRLKEVLDFVTK